jgi:hypothetical protein
MDELDSEPLREFAGLGAADAMAAELAKTR